uniref:Uncharacterized protein n=1 Tax=Oryza meridionalis TaxID=40149 RepID=A0A0E0EYA3_9ORYZ
MKVVKFFSKYPDCPPNIDGFTVLPDAGKIPGRRRNVSVVHGGEAAEEERWRVGARGEAAEERHGWSRAENGDLDVPAAESGLGKDAADDGVIKDGHEEVGDGGLVGLGSSMHVAFRCSPSDPTASLAGARERLVRLAPPPGHHAPGPPPHLVPLPGQTPPPLGRVSPHWHCRKPPTIDLAGCRASMVVPCRRPPWLLVSSHHVVPTSPHRASEAAVPFPAKSTEGKR